MRDYVELIQALRYCNMPDYQICMTCPFNNDDQCDTLTEDAADAIEELIRTLKDCRNELCLQCGAYKQRHMGVCNGCRWLMPPKEDAKCKN